MKFTMLENGFDFVLSAVEHLLEVENDDKLSAVEKQKLMKYSILHLSSGIELVFKYRLLQENWTFIFSDMNSAEKKNLEKGDFKSVDSKTLIRRLDNFCDIYFSDKDKRYLEKLRQRRNKIEHYEVADENLYAVESVVNKCLSIFVCFITDHLQRNKFLDEEQILFESIKYSIAKLVEHYDDIIKLVTNEIESKGIGEYVIPCPECEEPFLQCENAIVHCHFCDYTEDSSSAALNYLGGYRAIAQGGEPAQECPECGQDNFVFNEELRKYVCFSCGISYDAVEIDSCQNCGNLVRATVYEKDEEENNPVFCDNCLDNIPNRD